MKSLLALPGDRPSAAWLVLGIAYIAAQLVGCTPPPTATPTPTATALPTVTPAPAASPTPGAIGPDVDPVAHEVYELARADLARRLRIDAEAIELAELAALTWPDTSRGCPQAGRDYEAIEVPGYRLVLRVGDQAYIYHADFEAVFYCDAEDEVLPDSALP